ncbi:hypothetical protein QUW63_07340 [Pseudoflavonifractor phocaeensis]|uniref:class II glutamine amidotransferase n=1 Tax=Pseudoflavonifractor phocaeensis TaxID=1870988 RepID=UPI0025A4C7C8|nr:hypothetical protein [Pseudoflavonifractor phocaeensis]MDM8238917.1 hypothetical protein [Pseudoflavonifractor phocaeensis]
MCCLFGLIDTAQYFTRQQKNDILHALATVSEARGQDATGVAYCHKGALMVSKRPVPGHIFPLQIPYDAAVIMGHTRLTTQGSEKKNYNNHPFLAPAGTGSFALAHNGVIRNDRLLREQEQLPATKIETDSYIAVQLLARSGEVSIDSLRNMAERLEGSFSFTVLDDQNNLYFVKGDSPLCLYHYQTSGVYLYASTKQILEKALQQLSFDWEPPIQVPLECGEILQIMANGQERRATFDDSKLLCGLSYGRCTPFSWWGVGSSAQNAESGHLAALKSVAGYFGIAPWEIDRLMEAGFTEAEIEEYLYRTEM